MKVLVVGAINGDYDMLNKAFDTFLKEKYDRIIFTGSIYNCNDRSDEDILRCANIMNSMLRSMPDRVTCLIGKHDEPYLRYNPENYRCKGFRPLLHVKLNPLLVNVKKYYHYAFGIKNYLFTHAGLQYQWFRKHFNELDGVAEKIGIDITDESNLWMILDSVSRVAVGKIVFEAASETPDTFGGPMWCTMGEMLSKGPYPGLHQVCGGTPTERVYRMFNFDKGRRYKDTSVTYVDVLSHRKQFLTLEI